MTSGGASPFPRPNDELEEECPGKLGVRVTGRGPSGAGGIIFVWKDISWCGATVEEEEAAAEMNASSEGRFDSLGGY